MKALNYWLLSEELSVVQATLLFLEIDPDCVTHTTSDNNKKIPRYEAVETAISNALRSGAIQGKLNRPFHPEFNNVDLCDIVVDSEDALDVYESRVTVESLREWLLSRGMKSGFFFQTENDSPDYLDPKNPRFSPKLAAAVRAWQAVTNPKGLSVKKALENWLRQNAAELGLTDDDGKPINAAMVECSTISNWQTNGGAPKTPAG